VLKIQKNNLEPLAPFMNAYMNAMKSMYVNKDPMVKAILDYDKTVLGGIISEAHQGTAWADKEAYIVKSAFIFLGRAYRHKGTGLRQPSWFQELLETAKHVNPLQLPCSSTSSLSPSMTSPLENPVQAVATSPQDNPMKEPGHQNQKEQEEKKHKQPETMEEQGTQNQKEQDAMKDKQHGTMKEARPQN
jgi:hypothetical protein